MLVDLNAIPYVEARWKTKLPAQPHRSIDYIVIHSMESPEKGSTAESVAKYFQTIKHSASAHYNVDNDSIVCSVLLKDVAYHAPGLNHNGIGIEHAGYARQSRAEWFDEYSTEMLRDVSAPLVATLCAMYAIPVRFVDAAGLKRHERGITTHHEVSQAFKRSSHWDPGPGFPMDIYLTWVNDHLMPDIPEPESPRMSIVDVAIDPRTGGTYATDETGRIYTRAHGGPTPINFGDCHSAGVRTESVVAMTTTSTGYVLLGRDGGVFTFNTAFHGSYPGLPPEGRAGNREFIDIFASPGDGYTLVGDDLAQYHFGP